jgi:chitinase
MAYPAANDTHLARFSNWKLNLCMANYCGDSDTATMVDTIDHTASDVSSYRGGRTWGDIGPRLSIPETGSIVEGNSGTRQMWIRASLDKSSPNPVYFEVDAFASSFGGSDIIEPVPGTVLTIPAGGLYRDFPITIIGDTVAEPDETFYVSLRNVSGAFPSSSMLATIVNDDKPNLTIADASVTEGDSGTKVMNFTVSLSSPTSGPVTFDVATITPAGTTATANVDFVPFTAHLQMPLGTTTKTFAVTIKGDTASEPNETFIASITNVVGAIATDGAARGTILNDDLPSLSINDVAMAEGNSGTKQMVFTVRASQVSAAPITFTPALNPGAGMDSADFDFTNGPLTIAAGQLARTVPVTIKGDTLVEADEVFVVSLGNVQGAAVADGAGKGTILNDDVVVPTMGIADATVVEGDSGTTSMNFTVSLSSATTVPVTFDLATSTANGATATANTDFVPVVAHLQMPAGTTTKTFAVTIKGDTVAEADETFFVDVTNAVGATIADGTALGTIASDDATPPTLSIADVSVVEGNSDTKVAVFTAQLSKPATVPVSFVYLTYLADGATASANQDFEHINEIHTIPVGQSALSLPVTIYGDTEPEIDEIFFVRIDSVEGATLVDGAAKGTIRNDDLPVMTIGDTAAVEGNSGNPIATFTVQLTGPAAAPITFDIGTYDTPGATAKPGTDYVAKAQTRTIPMGVSSAVFNVGLIGDTTIEPNEVFVVTLSNVSGPVVLGDGAARATILNDD